MVALNYEKLNSYQEYNKDGKPVGFRLADFYHDHIQPDLIILDEAHCLGQYPVPANKVSQTAALSQLLPIIYLSGTPSPESYSQLYHQLQCSSFSPFLAYRTFYEWAKGVDRVTKEGVHIKLPAMVSIKQKMIQGRLMNDYSKANKEIIDNFTKHLFITMTQQEAEFNQEVEDIRISVVMKPSTHYIAKKLIKDRLFKGQDGSVVLGDTPAKLQQKLHQIYSGTVIAEIFKPDDMPDEAISKDDPKAFDDSKAVFIKHYFVGQKIAILYVYKMELELIKNVFGKENITDNADIFRTSDKIYVNQIRSAREGVDLSSANALVMFNIEFSALSYMQGRQRMQTRDRTEPARCYWVFSDNGIEHKIYERVINKLSYTTDHFKKDYL